MQTEVILKIVPFLGTETVNSDLSLIFRAIFRLVLLLRNKSGLQTSPPIIPLDRGVELTEEGPFSFLFYLLIIVLKMAFCLLDVFL